MKHGIAIAAAALGGTGALVVPAASASPSAPKTHTLTFTSVQEPQVNFSKTVFTQQDKDVNKAGKVVGHDLMYFVFNPKTSSTPRRMRRSSTSPPSSAAASCTGWPAPRPAR